jgi:hypothetical protein
MRSVLFGFMLALGACSSASGDQDDRAGARDFPIGDFRSVAVEGHHNVIVRVGGRPSVRAEGRERDLERLRIRVENGVLRIDDEQRERSILSFDRGREVTVHVTVPALQGARVTGSGQMQIDRVQAEAFEGAVTGSGDLRVAMLRAARASFAVSGSGDVQAAGEVPDLTVAVTGSGEAGFEGLRSRRAQVAIAGSGDVRVHASEAVQGSVMGSGNFLVRGGGRCNVTRAGSGDVHCG